MVSIPPVQPACASCCVNESPHIAVTYIEGTALCKEHAAKAVESRSKHEKLNRKAARISDLLLAGFTPESVIKCDDLSFLRHSGLFPVPPSHVGESDD